MIIGFESLEVRVLDGSEPTLDTNMFQVKGTAGKGGTLKADITGLTSDIIKTFASNIVYHTNAKGVGDLSVGLETVDVPFVMLNAILGRKKVNGLTSIGVDTEAPLCSLVLWGHDGSGQRIGIGFYKGRFGMEAINLETKGKDNKELPSEKLSFVPQASDEGETVGQYLSFATSEEEATKLRKALKLTV
ncbi:major tail protein [Streptococcus suis]|uniref:major tail protein n=1 Tax=Streptococcus suis TaxID=1307 RepID=UPI00241035ED|nr:major tail protein [Streptococcus suis]MDG3136268.1 phage tail protein [Streptococcus suis]